MHMNTYELLSLLFLGGIFLVALLAYARQFTIIFLTDKMS